MTVEMETGSPREFREPGFYCFCLQCKRDLCGVQTGANGHHTLEFYVLPRARSFVFLREVVAQVLRRIVETVMCSSKMTKRHCGVLLSIGSPREFHEPGVFVGPPSMELVNLRLIISLDSLM